MSIYLQNFPPKSRRKKHRPRAVLKTMNFDQLNWIPKAEETNWAPSASESTGTQQSRR